MPGKLLLTVLAFALAACHGIREKGGEVLDRAKEKAGQAVEDAFTDFDPAPDSEKNKKAFRKFFGAEPGADVDSIRGFDDYLGADYSVFMSFRCAPATADSIVARLQLEAYERPEHEHGYFDTEQPWWEKERIEKLPVFRAGKEGEYWKYFWYEKKTGKAFYEEFSL